MHKVISVLLQVTSIALVAQLVTGLPKASTSGESAFFKLVARQSTSSIPTSCQSICNPVVSVIDSQCTPQQCCTAAFERNLTTCYECVGNLTGVTNWSQPQSTVDELRVECATEGLSIPEFTFPGQNPNRTISGLPSSTAAASKSSTASGSTTAFHQSTITSVGFASLTFTQSTVTSLSSSSSSAASDPVPSVSVVPASASASVTGSNGNGATSVGWDARAVIISLMAMSALVFGL